MYIWTAPGGGAAGIRRVTGVSDDQTKAREAAEAALYDVQTGTAYIERVYTALAAPALSLSYVRTGTGWRAQAGRAGGVVWTPFSTVAERHFGDAARREAASRDGVGA